MTDSNSTAATIKWGVRKPGVTADRASASSSFAWAVTIAPTHAASVPPMTLVPPVCDRGPPSVNVPAPDFTSAPFPLMDPSKRPSNA